MIFTNDVCVGNNYESERKIHNMGSILGMFEHVHERSLLNRNVPHVINIQNPLSLQIVPFRTQFLVIRYESYRSVKTEELNI